MPAALACSLAVMPVSRNARTFTLFSGSSCITAEKINKCLKPRLPLVKASADTRGPRSPGSSLKMGCEGGPAGGLAVPPHLNWSDPGRVWGSCRPSMTLPPAPGPPSRPLLTLSSLPPHPPLQLPRSSYRYRPAPLALPRRLLEGAQNLKGLTSLLLVVFRDLDKGKFELK